MALFDESPRDTLPGGWVVHRPCPPFRRYVCKKPGRTGCNRVFEARLYTASAALAESSPDKNARSSSSTYGSSGRYVNVGIRVIVLQQRLLPVRVATMAKESADPRGRGEWVRTGAMHEIPALVTLEHISFSVRMATNIANRVFLDLGIRVSRRDGTCEWNSTYLQGRCAAVVAKVGLDHCQNRIGGPRLVRRCAATSGRAPNAPHPCGNESRSRQTRPAERPCDGAWAS